MYCYSNSSLPAYMERIHITGDSGYPHYPNNGYHHHHHQMEPIKVEPDTIMDVDVDAYSPGSDYQGMGPGGAGRIRKNKEDKICGVCGDRALGYNFDAISCESCKAFFRRNAPKGLEFFKCPYDEKCKMDVSNRRFCKRCRLKKCFEIGMRKEYILTEEEKIKKKEQIQRNREKTEQERLLRELEKQGLVNMGDPAVTSQTLALSQEDAEHIEELKSAYRGSLEVKIEKEPRRDQAKDMADLANICEVSVRRVIDMAKKVRCFKALGQVDQISLLKGGSIELLILRSVITFDKDKQQFLESGDSEETSGMSVEQLRKAENGTGLFDEHMKFVKALLVDMRADQETLILLLMISLFSPDRPNLVNRVEVTSQQEKYSILLKKYLESKYPVPIARSMYPKLLMKLTDIRNLNEGHSQVLLKVNPEGIQPLMQEVLDLGKEQEEREAAAAAAAAAANATATAEKLSPPMPPPAPETGFM